MNGKGVCGLFDEACGYVVDGVCVLSKAKRKLFKCCEVCNV